MATVDISEIVQEVKSNEGVKPPKKKYKDKRKHRVSNTYAVRGEYYKKYIREQWKKNPEKMKARARTSYHQRKKSDPTYIRNKRVKEREYQRRIRDSIYGVLGGAKCNKCGFSDVRALQIDHVNGGGTKSRKRGEKGYLKCGTGYYRMVLTELLNGSKEYQILCANCNWIKRVENKEVKQITYI